MVHEADHYLSLEQRSCDTNLCFGEPNAQESMIADLEWPILNLASGVLGETQKGGGVWKPTLSVKIFCQTASQPFAPFHCVDLVMQTQEPFGWLLTLR